MSLKSRLKKLCFILPSCNVLMFHHISRVEKPVSGCMLSVENFEKIINSLKKVENTEVLFKKNIYRNETVLTFDDGIEDVYTVAYPILKEKGIPFTIFILTDFIGKDGYLSKEQLLYMSKDPLVTIAAHGVTHKTMRECTYEEKKVEIFESKKILEGIIEKPIKMFAYSHGVYDKDSIQMVKRAGYKICFGTESYPLNLLTKLFLPHCPRFNVTDDTVEKIIKLL